MRHDMFLLIEGDNGTGKDSLALELQKYGFFIISYCNQAKELEIQAKKCKGTSKIIHFLHYNKLCGQLAAKQDGDSILIRYWISTLAAAYADNIYNEDYVVKTAKRMSESMPRPDLLIFLLCEFACRIGRINSRNGLDKSLQDDTTVIRDKRYQRIIPLILSASHYDYIMIDNTRKTPSETSLEIITYLKKKEMFYGKADKQIHLKG